MWRTCGGAKRVLLGARQRRSCEGQGRRALTYSSSTTTKRPRFVSVVAREARPLGLLNAGALTSTTTTTTKTKTMRTLAQTAIRAFASDGRHQQNQDNSLQRQSNNGQRKNSNPKGSNNNGRNTRSSNQHHHHQQQQQQAKRQQHQAPDAAAISDITSELAAIKHQISNAGLEYTTPIWKLDVNTAERESLPTTEEGELLDQQQRQEILSRISSVVDYLRHYVLDKNILRPSGKHRHEFSTILERIFQLYLYCSNNNSNNTPVPQQLFEQHVSPLLQLLNHFQLELTHAQCHTAVQLAAREGLWEMAAELYANHIDPDRGGYTPAVNVWRETVTGLYCLARASQPQQLAVEKVLEGVLHLSLVSPSDAEKYVLGAGEALGHAGEWEGLRDYLKSSYRASELGQPLVAATMHACVLCQRHDEALAVFDDLLCGELAASASEWQWGGGEDRLHPACRDLAMRALGGITATIADTKTVRERALKLFFQALEEDSKVSVEALTAVVATCDLDGAWETVFDLFLSVLDKSPDSWLVMGEGVQLTVDKSEPELSSDELVSELGLFLDRVMQACNSSKKYGLALLCLQLFDVSLASTIRSPSEEHEEEASTEQMNLPQFLLSTARGLRNSADLITTTMVALCGARVPQIAMDLEELFNGHESVRQRDKFDCYSYAEHLKETSNASSNWEAVHRHMHRLSICLRSIEERGGPVTESDAQVLSSVLATSIREFVAAGHPEAAIAVGKWVERRNLQSPHQNASAIFSQGDEGLRLPFPLTDSLFSAAVEAFREMGRSDVAANLIHSHLGDEHPPAKWLLSYHEAVKTMFSRGRNDDGMLLFRTILANGRNPGMFCTAAQNLKSLGDWRAILDLYRLALSSGCVSEKLGMLAMESVGASGRDKQFPLLRSIIAETARSVGSNPADWVATNYWALKRLLGFSTARLIMGWDDHMTSRLDELELALEVMEKRSATGLTPKNDVLMSIAGAAADFDRLSVPYNKTGIAKVPRDREGWVRTLERAIEEARDTRLLFDNRFIGDAATAFERLGCNLECIDIVNAAISRGLRLRRPALESALRAAEAEGIEAMASNIEMLLADQ